MFGLSKIQLGMLMAAGLAIITLTAYAKHQTEIAAIAKQNVSTLNAVIGKQERDKSALRTEITARDALITEVQAERDKLAQRRDRVRTVIREVLVNDPKAAECGNAPVPESVARIVREFSSPGHGDGDGPDDAAGESGSGDPGAAMYPGDLGRPAAVLDGRADSAARIEQPISSPARVG